MKRLLVFSGLLIVLTTPASAAWYPQVDPGYLRLEVGETGSVRVIAIWTGIWIVPWTDWTFYTTDRAVASASGRMRSSSTYDVPVTGVAPGTVSLRIRPFGSDYAQIEVVCGKEDPIHPAEATLLARREEPVTLEAVTPIAHRTTFAWYRGRVGDLSSPIAASGPVLSITPARTEYVWVLATTPCSSSTAEFLVQVPGKRRAVRF